jgi:hypothetical protein
MARVPSRPLSRCRSVHGGGRRLSALRMMAAGVLLALAGCTGSRHSASQPRQMTPVSAATAVSKTTVMPSPPSYCRGSAIYAGPITRDANHPDAGIYLSVPPASVRPEVPWQDALWGCQTAGGVCSLCALCTVSLALGREVQMAPRSSTTATTDDSGTNYVLVYVLAQPYGPCGPVGPSGSRQRTVVMYPSCTLLSFTNAQNGQGYVQMKRPCTLGPLAPQTDMIRKVPFERAQNDGLPRELGVRARHNPAFRRSYTPVRRKRSLRLMGSGHGQWSRRLPRRSAVLRPQAA